MIDPTPDALVPIRQGRRLFPAVGSAMTIHRRLGRGEFPYPVATIGGERHWRMRDLIEWNAGKRSGWKPTPDPAAAARAAKAAHARSFRRAAMHAAGAAA